MVNSNIKDFIYECVKQALYEGVFDKTAAPYMSKADAQRELGRNPLRTDVGGHSAHDEVRQVSTFDTNGANFNGEHIFVSDNKFMIYKIKNFGNPDIKGTLSIFGDGSKGEKELRRAIDTVNGAAKRNGKGLYYRTITSETNKRKAEMSSYMTNTFWEFSFDRIEWYIMKPNPVQSLKISKFSK